MYSAKEAQLMTPRLQTASVLLLGLFSATHLGKTSATEDEKSLLSAANDMFDAVWCPLPTWVKVLLVIAAWIMCYRVATDLFSGSKGKQK